MMTNKTQKQKLESFKKFLSEKKKGLLLGEEKFEVLEIVYHNNGSASTQEIIKSMDFGSLPRKITMNKRTVKNPSRKFSKVDTASQVQKQRAKVTRIANFLVKLELLSVETKLTVAECKVCSRSNKKGTITKQGVLMNVYTLTKLGQSILE